MAKHTKAEIAASTDTLREILKPGDRVYTKILHVARSGMSRVFAVYIARDGEVWDISRTVARALDSGFDESRWGVRVSGVGMDMGWHLVYSLSSHLFNDGYALKQEWL